MLFNSYIFVLLFLPLCLVGWFSLNRLPSRKPALLFLLGMSLWFYGYFNPKYIPIILCSIGGNYLLSRLMQKAAASENARQRTAPPRKTILLALGLLANIGVLFYYKYMNFFLTEAGSILGKTFPLRTIVLPLGISFFTFQQISFLVDSWRGETEAYSLLEYACFVAYFPQLIAGPIVTHDELIPQLRAPENRRLNWDNLARGLYLFSLGLGKKVLLADLFGNVANVGFNGVDALDSTGALVSMLAYTLQIYLDFSGYCDMALGIGKMMNIDLPGNFDSPYKALDIQDFWDRWHKTLTRFLTRYVYIPLGGSRKGKLRTYVNVMLVFLISGLWHGAGMSFLFCGVLHGAASVLTRMVKASPGLQKLHPPKWLRWLLTFAFLNITWVFFRANSLSEGFRFISALFSGNFGPVAEGYLSAFHLPEVTALCRWFSIDSPNYPAMLIGFFLLNLLSILFLPNDLEKTERFQPTAGRMVYAAVVFVWSVFSLSGVSTFLYFNF